MLFEAWLVHQRYMLIIYLTFFAVLTVKIGDRVLKLTELLIRASFLDLEKEDRLYRFLSHNANSIKI